MGSTDTLHSTHPPDRAQQPDPQHCTPPAAGVSALPCCSRVHCSGLLQHPTAVCTGMVMGMHPKTKWKIVREIKKSIRINIDPRPLLPQNYMEDFFNTISTATLDKDLFCFCMDSAPADWGKPGSVLLLPKQWPSGSTGAPRSESEHPWMPGEGAKRLLSKRWGDLASISCIAAQPRGRRGRNWSFRMSISKSDSHLSSAWWEKCLSPRAAVSLPASPSAISTQCDDY